MAPSPTLRRLLKETSELSAQSKNPNPAFHAAPVSDTDLHEWHFTLLGPPAPSPYAGGLYHGRISLPPTYPLKPPNFRFLTPSGRFEVNREICLSISGFHEETWMPAWGVRTALTALRSFMAESGTAGQVGGLEAPKEVRERLAKESRSWKCKECGGRTNEDVMKQWWESCAARGVKVGEDVGLEVLPEGMNLEVKRPGGVSTGVEATSKQKEEEEHSSPDAVSYGTNVALKQTPELQADVPIPEHLASLPQSNITPTSHQALRNRTHTSPSIPTSTTSTAESNSQTQQHHPSHSSIISHPHSHSQPQPIRTTATSEIQQSDITTLTIDRAIYVVFLALCVMILKKIFYPAGSQDGWEDYTLVRE